MSKTAQKMEPSPRARKLVEQHARAIDQTADEAARRISSPSTALGAVVHLLNQRSRYFGGTGEHFSVTEYDGILVIDTLDERLLRCARAMLSSYVERARKKPEAAVLELLARELSPGARELPQYPVGYMVYYMLVSTVQAFEPLAEQGHGFELPQFEIALVHHLLGILDKYLQTREKPVMRHFSDIAREHNVVTRLKCSCGAEKYEVKLQALCFTSAGEPFDRLDLQCRDCSRQRSITFDLPHFKDIYRL